MQVLAVDEVTKVFGRRTVLHNVSFGVERGATVGLVGPNGAGKTTLLHIALGLVRPSSGEIRLWGTSSARSGVAGSKVGWVLETVGLHPGFTAAESLSLLGAKLGVALAKQTEVLETVGLTEAARCPVGVFSLGMRQRLALAAALLSGPELLLLDEPMNGLDPSGMRWLRNLMLELRRDGCAIVVSSHLLDELARIADEIVVLDEGRVIAAGNVSDLSRTEREAIDIETSDNATAQSVLAEQSFTSRLVGDRVRVWGGRSDEVVRILVGAGVDLHEVVKVRSTLEDAVLARLDESRGK